MKNRILSIFLALVLVVSMVAFIACGEEEEPAPPPTPPVEPKPEPKPEPEPEPEPEPPWEWPDRILALAGSALSIASTTGWTSELSKDTGMTIRVVSETNIVNKFRWHKEGRFFTNSEGNMVLKNVIEGNLGYSSRDIGPYQMRMLWAASKSDVGFCVRGDSDIETIYDIGPGTKIIDLAWVSGAWIYPKALLAWLEVDEEDIIRVPASSHDAAMRAIQTGTADVTFEFPVHPAVIEAAAAPEGIRWLDLPYDTDPEGAKRFLEVSPTSGFGIASQTAEIAGVKTYVGMNCIIVQEQADTELVYNVCKWLDENYDLYKDNHAWNQYMTMDNTMVVLEQQFVPAHDGLIKYLKEKGLWIAAHDARQAYNVELLTRYCNAFQQAIDLADEKGIMVSSENEEWVELWENHKNQLNLPPIRLFVDLKEQPSPLP